MAGIYQPMAARVIECELKVKPQTAERESMARGLGFTTGLFIISLKGRSAVQWIMLSSELTACSLSALLLFAAVLTTCLFDCSNLIHSLCPHRATSTHIGWGQVPQIESLNALWRHVERLLTSEGERKKKKVAARNKWVCWTECVLNPVDSSAAHVGRRRGRIQRGHLSRSEWSNILTLPIGASCHCTAAASRFHSVQLILATACKDQSPPKKKAVICDLLCPSLVFTKRKMIQID